jgi:dihydrofolate synthase/folylpolyglutamate synthase
VAEVLASALAETFDKPYAIGVLGVLGDKDATQFFEILDDSFVEVVITQSSSPRAVAAETLAETARKVFGADRVHVAADPMRAIELAKQQLALAGERAGAGAIVVTGSITLIGDVLRIKQQEMDEDV